VKCSIYYHTYGNTYYIWVYDAWEMKCSILGTALSVLVILLIAGITSVIVPTPISDYYHIWTYVL